MIDFTTAAHKADPTGAVFGAGAAGDYDLTDAFRFKASNGLGIGKDVVAKIQVTDSLAAGGTSMQAYVKAAPDNGSGAPGTYVDAMVGPVVLLAAIKAGKMLLDGEIPNTVVGEWYKFGVRTLGAFTTGAKLQGWMEDS